MPASAVPSVHPIPQLADVDPGEIQFLIDAKYLTLGLHNPVPSLIGDHPVGCAKLKSAGSDRPLIRSRGERAADCFQSRLLQRLSDFRSNLIGSQLGFGIGSAWQGNFVGQGHRVFKDLQSEINL